MTWPDVVYQIITEFVRFLYSPPGILITILALIALSHAFRRAVNAINSTKIDLISMVELLLVFLVGGMLAHEYLSYDIKGHSELFNKLFYAFIISCFFSMAFYLAGQLFFKLYASDKSVQSKDGDSQ